MENPVSLKEQAWSAASSSVQVGNSASGAAAITITVKRSRADDEAAPTRKHPRLQDDELNVFTDDILPGIFSNLNTGELGAASAVGGQWSKAFDDGVDPTIVVSEAKLIPEVGRDDSGYDYSTWSFSVKKQEWSPLPKAPNTPSAQMVRIDRYLYFPGSQGNAVVRYDPYDNSWASVDGPPIEFNNRSEFGSAAVGGKLVVIGGKNSDGSVESCKFSNESNGPTMSLQSLPNVMSLEPNALSLENRIFRIDDSFSTRSMAGAACVGGHIYSIGGVMRYMYPSGCNADSVDASAQCLTLGSDYWKMIAPMNVARWSFKACSVGDCVYVLGGMSTTGVCDDSFSPELTVEKYCPKGDSWTIVTSLPTWRTGFGVAAVGRWIYLVGGRIHTGIQPFFAGKRSDLVEIFDTQTGEWSVGPPLPKPAEKLAAVSYARFDSH